MAKDKAVAASVAALELEEDCPTCDKGMVYNTEWDDWRAQRAKGIEERPPFKPETIPCRACMGKGKRLTDTGRALLEVIRRHL